MRLLLAWEIWVRLGYLVARQFVAGQFECCSGLPSGKLQRLQYAWTNSHSRRFEGKLLVCATIWWRETLGLRLVEPLDCQYWRGSSWGCWLASLLLRENDGQGQGPILCNTGQEQLRREAIYRRENEFRESPEFLAAKLAGVEALSTERGPDSSSQYTREVQRLFLAWLPQEDRDFLKASEGLGNSQKAEVAWLERKGYAYTEVDVSAWIPKWQLHTPHILSTCFNALLSFPEMYRVAKLRNKSCAFLWCRAFKGQLPSTTKIWHILFVSFLALYAFSRFHFFKISAIFSHSFCRCMSGCGQDMRRLPGGHVHDVQECKLM